MGHVDESHLAMRLRSLPEEIARAILQVFRQQHSRPGYGLPAVVITGLAEQKDWTTDQIVAGVEYGYLAQWFEIRPKLSIRLTESGFFEMLQAEATSHSSHPKGVVTLPCREREGVVGLSNCQAAPTAVRHVASASARSTR